MMCIAKEVLGFGTYALGRNAPKAVAEALAAGYRLIDTAQIYERGRTEQAVGQALQAARQKVFVTTKVWRPESFEKTLKACEQSLKPLGAVLTSHRSYMHILYINNHIFILQ